MVANLDPRLSIGGGEAFPAGACTPQAQLEHLLKVAGSVSVDANKVWADLWAEFKPHVCSGGAIGPELKKKFVPACGWPEFLEKLWLLKHYLDSIERICAGRH